MKARRRFSRAAGGLPPLASVLGCATAAGRAGSAGPADPFRAAARLHDGPDIFWARDAALGLSGWVLTRRDLMQEAFLDYAHFGNMSGPDGASISAYRASAQASGVTNSFNSGFKLLPLLVDPPQHTGYRLILNPFFMPRAMNQLDATTAGSGENMGSRTVLCLNDRQTLAYKTFLRAR